MSKFFYPVVFHPENIGYSVAVPDLDGCFTEGDTLDEAYEMAFDAIGLCVTDLLENKKIPPKASNPQTIQHEPDGFIALVEFDLDAYNKKHHARASNTSTSFDETTQFE